MPSSSSCKNEDLVNEEVILQKLEEVESHVKVGITWCQKVYIFNFNTRLIFKHPCWTLQNVQNLIEKKSLRDDVS